jgi:hypothetical protein
MLCLAIQAEVMRQCDGADGVLDEIISAPDRCDFHPETLLCNPYSSQFACFTSPQIETLYKIYGNWIETNQTFVFPNTKSDLSGSGACSTTAAGTVNSAQLMSGTSSSTSPHGPSRILAATRFWMQNELIMPKGSTPTTLICSP